MPNEAIISRIETLLDEVVSLGGASERTGIVSGLIVVDSAPSSAALANHIIVRDSRDGNFISVLKTPGQTYANNDLVSVLFIEGTEPIALAQSPGSSSGNVKVSEVWESDFGAVAGSADAAGDWTWQNDVTLASGDIALAAGRTVDGVDVSAHAVNSDAHHDQLHAMTGASDHSAGNWKLFHSNGSGAVAELALGDAGTFLRSNGAAAAPSFGAAGAISHFLALPGLRGFWPMSAYDASGNAFDQSGNARTLTYNGNPTYNFDGLAPYIDLDGTGDFLSRADEAGLDILGTETYVANPGLTLGGWFWFDNAAISFEMAMSKYSNGTGNRSFGLRRTNGGVAQFLISNDGTTTPAVSHTATVGSASWHFIAGRFTPSTELAIFDNGVKITNTTSIPASIFNSNTAFQVCGLGGTNQLMTGRASLCFLCASALSDAIVDNLFQSSRALFGV